MKRTWSRLAAAGLCACIILLSPGPQAWAAAAAISAKTAGSVAGVPVVPSAGITAGLGASSGLRLQLQPAGLGQTSLSKIPALSGPGPVAVVAAPAARLEAPSPKAPAVSLSPEGTAVSVLTAALPQTAAPEGSLQGLQNGVETLQKAEAPAAKQSILSRLFTGGRICAPADDTLQAPAPGQTSSSSLAPSRAEAKTAAPVPTVPAAAPDFNKKAVIALFVTRTLSIASFILTSIAFPFVAAPAVGWALYGTLMALGPLAAIATGPLNGSLADKLSARNSMVINVGLRAILTLALPAFTYFGILNFWTLLLSSVANGWVLSSTMTTENAYIRRLAGRHQATVTALSQVHYVGLQVLLGLIVGIGSFIDKGNPITAFLISALVHGLIITPILWFTMPNDKPQGAVKKAAVKLVDAARGFFKQYWKEALLVTGAVGAYFLLHSPLPIAGALFFWVLRSKTVRDLRAGLLREKAAREAEIAARVAELEKSGGAPVELAALKAEAKRYEKRQFRAILYSSLQAVLTYPFQNFALPLIAATLMGAAGKALLLGQLTGAVFFGNLISNSTQVSLPDISIPFTAKKVPGQRLVQAAVLGLGAVWVGTSLVPGSLIAAAAAVAVGAAAMWAVGHLSPRGWIKFLGVGLLAIWLPYLVWAAPGLLPFLSVQKALFLTMLVYGMFTGPAAVSFNNYMQSNTRKQDLGKVFGTSSSFFNTFNSLGYGLLSMAAGLLNPVLPPLLLGIASAYVAGAALFWRAPRHMPGLPESSYSEKK
ncbi:MAG: MFS transporter [Elusimicrobia bacterium]|nr:MFS transporter [Elusimicrobiota bacterium]